jgi:very-short-patch-repair endonuclease
MGEVDAARSASGEGGSADIRRRAMPESLLSDRARGMRREPTEAERRLWRLLRDRRLGAFKFRRQEILGRYIVDFVCFDRRLIIELDGSQHAESAYDSERDAWLRSRGFEIMRFWNSEVLTNPSGVQHAIATSLGLPWVA